MNRNLYDQIDSKEHEMRKLVAKEREAEIIELLKDYQEFNIEDCQIDIYPEHDNPADNFTLEFRFHSHDFENEDTEKIMETIINGLPKDWIIIPKEEDYYDTPTGYAEEYSYKVQDTNLEFSLGISAFNMFHKEYDCDNSLLWTIYNGREKVIYSKKEVHNLLTRKYPAEIQDSIDVGKFLWGDTEKRFWYLGTPSKDYAHLQKWFVYAPAYYRLKEFIEKVCDGSFQKAYDIISKDIWIK